MLTKKEIVPITNNIKELSDYAKPILMAVYNKFYKPGVIEKWVGDIQSPEAIAKDISDGMKYFYIKENDEKAGYIAIKHDKEKNELILSKYYVEERLRGHGLGKFAMNFINSFGKEKKLKNVYCFCSHYNNQSLDIYEKLGFKQRGDDIFFSLNHYFQTNDIVSAYCEELQAKRDAVIVNFRGIKNEQVYVHFLGEDRRLDTWVARSSLEPARLRVVPQHSRSNSVQPIKNGIRLFDDSRKWKSIFNEIHQQITIVRNVDKITINNQTIRPWYFSPYPYPYGWRGELYVCDHCLDYFSTQKGLEDHTKEFSEIRPPGREIYREGIISIFEMCGKDQRYTCQCLCLFAKLFIDRKTLYYDVDDYVFYLLCECDEDGAHMAAFFSKELQSENNNILSCICVFPMYQRRGYGRLLISLSYEIAKRQNRVGGPERPFSELGKIAFYAYWRDTITECIKKHEDTSITVKELAQSTLIQEMDVIEVVKQMKWLEFVEMSKVVLYSNCGLHAELENPEYRKRVGQFVKPELLFWFDGDDERNDISDEYVFP